MQGLLDTKSLTFICPYQLLIRALGLAKGEENRLNCLTHIYKNAFCTANFPPFYLI